MYMYRTKMAKHLNGDLIGIPLIPNSKNPMASQNNGRNWRPIKDIRGNYGILCGNAINRKNPLYHNNGITVVDIDFFNAKNKDKYDLENHEFLNTFGNDFIKRFNTLTFRTTSGGLHLMFKYQDIGTTINQTYGIDIKNDWGYIVGCGSVVNGKKYTCVNDVPIINIPNELLEWINDKLYTNTKNNAKTNAKNNTNTNHKENNNNSYWNYRITDDVFKTIAETLPSSYFTEYQDWLKWTTFCKIIDRKTEWDMYNKKRGSGNYNKENNDKLWCSVDKSLYMVEHIINQSIQKPMCYFKYKNIPTFSDYPYNEVINRPKLGYTYFNELIENHADINTLLIKSDTGTGKTTSMASFLKSQPNYNFISIVSRVSLGAEQYNKVFSERYGLKCDFYKYKEGSFFTGDNLVIQLESITRCWNIDFSNYVIFIDEINSVIEHLVQSSTFNKHRTIVFQMFSKMIRNAKLVIGTDADISPICNEFLLFCSRNIYFAKNEYKHNNGIVATEYNNLDNLRNMISKTPKYMVCCDSKSEADKLYEKLNDESVKLITSDITDEYINLDEYDKVIFSPKIIYGLDSSMKRPIFCIYTTNTITPPQMVQQIARARNIEKLYYCFINKTTKEAEYKDFNECLDIHKRMDIMTFNEFHLMTTEEIATFYFKLYCMIEYKNDCYNTNKFCWFKNLLNDRGFIDDTNIYGSKTYIDKESEKEITKKIKEARIMDYEKFVDKINPYLQIPENELDNYKELFADPFKLKTHFQISNFLFKYQTSKELRNNVSGNVNEFAVAFANSSIAKINFLFKLLEKTNGSTNYNPQNTLTETQATRYYEKYSLTFRDRRKTPLDFTNKNDITKCLSKIYTELFGDLFNKQRVKGKDPHYAFYLNNETFEYHKKLANYRLNFVDYDEEGA